MSGMSDRCGVITMRVALPGDEPILELASLHLRLCDVLEDAGFDAEAIHFTLALEASMPEAA